MVVITLDKPFRLALKIVLWKHKLTQVDESKKRNYANKVGKELLTKASSRIPGLKADIE